MLQQTQASRVIPFYKKWMEQFPTVDSLANASIDDVLMAWEGLGYYSRARNLHIAAKQMKDGIPDSHEELSTIKGLGPYSIGAIRTFAFKQRVVAVDANVMRVISRYYKITENIDTNSTKKKIGNIVEGLLPEKEPWIISEALIELGALVCTKNPDCAICPLQNKCAGKGENLPNKSKRAKTTHLYRVVAVILTPQGVILNRKEKDGLWEFPYIELPTKKYDLNEVASRLEKRYSLSLTYEKPLTPLSHSFTRYRAHLFPHIWKSTSRKGVNANDFPLTAGHRRVANQLDMS